MGINQSKIEWAGLAAAVIGGVNEGVDPADILAIAIVAERVSTAIQAALLRYNTEAAARAMRVYRQGQKRGGAQNNQGKLKSLQENRIGWLDNTRLWPRDRNQAPFEPPQQNVAAPLIETEVKPQEHPKEPLAEATKTFGSAAKFPAAMAVAHQFADWIVT